MGKVELKPEWAEEIDRRIESLHQFKIDLLDFYRRIGEEIEKRGWFIQILIAVNHLWNNKIHVFKQDSTKDDFFEMLQLIGDVLDYHPKYDSCLDEDTGKLYFLHAIWNHPYYIHLIGYDPKGCKVEYKEVTKKVYELVKVDCPEFQEEANAD